MGTSFFKLKTYLPEGFEILCLDYPGKGGIPADPTLQTVQDVAKRLLEHIRPYLDDPIPKVSFLGFSLGGLVAYETASWMSREGLRPQLLIAASIYPPQLQGRKVAPEKFHLLDDDQFLDRMEKAMDLHTVFFKDPKFRRAFLPTLRKEMKMAETYRFQRKKERLSCPILALYGRNDKALFNPTRPIQEYQKHLGLWRELTSVGLTLNFAEGGHFFLLDDPIQGMEVVRKALVGLDDREGIRKNRTEKRRIGVD